MAFGVIDGSYFVIFGSCLADLYGGEEMMLGRLRELHKGARIARNGVLSDLWGYLIGECTRNDKDPSDEVVMRVLEKFVNSMPVVDDKSKSKLEVEAVRVLLPEKLGEDAIRVIVKDFLLNADGNVTIGLVMSHFKERYAGQYMRNKSNTYCL